MLPSTRPLQWQPAVALVSAGCVADLPCISVNAGCWLHKGGCAIVNPVFVRCMQQQLPSPLCSLGFAGSWWVFVCCVWVATEGGWHSQGMDGQVLRLLTTTCHGFLGHSGWAPNIFLDVLTGSRVSALQC